MLYLHGFASGPGSTKARFFERQFAVHGIQLLIPDLSGGDFEHLTITEQLNRVERTAGPGQGLVVAGSSLGGYLAALYAARHPEVERVVLLAPAFRFRARLAETLGQAEMARWRETGWRNVFHYGDGRDRRLSYALMEDAQCYEDFPDLPQPTLLLHGTRDEVVPSAYSIVFARSHPNVSLVLLDSGHELTDVTDRLWDEMAGFLGLNGTTSGTGVKSQDRRAPKAPAI
jgi:pimeloyl-ACP methyl ester carboxylesterase